MDPNTYLASVLKSQDLDDDSQELKDLQEHRKGVENILRDAFPEASPTIQYDGSKAKGTLIRESYDLDVICYFSHDENRAGATLKEIFENVANKLAEAYYVERKTSAIRLKDKENKIDFHIDVVPGRYVDDSKTDCFIYQNCDGKERLKTNLDVHIDHIKNSGVVPAIRLSKLWKTRRGLCVRQFAFELLIIKLLEDKKEDDLDSQMKHVWNTLAEAKDPICVEDPANPTGNDMSELLKTVWPELSARARDTMALLEQSGWEAIFGPIDEEEEDGNNAGKTSNYVRAAAALVAPTKPWLP